MPNNMRCIFRLSSGYSLWLSTLFLFLLFPILAQGQPSDNRVERLENLTHRLVKTNAAHNAAASADKGRWAQELHTLASERRELLSDLVDENPQAMLRVALPEELQSSMPSELSELIEQHAVVEGEVEVLYEDGEDGSHRLRHFIKTADERIELHLKRQPKGLITGTQVAADGVLLGSDLAVTSDEDILTLAVDGGSDGGSNGGTPGELPGTFGEQSTLVMLVNFQDDSSRPWTTGEVQNLLEGTPNDFFMENSYGQSWLGVTVVGWYTLPLSSSTCNISDISDAANAAAANAGVNLGAYSHHIYAFPRNSACGFGGVGTVGGSPSRAWINGKLDWWTYTHELGHNLGLYHSHDKDCGSQVLGNNCSITEYGDIPDIMGSGIKGHFNAFQKDRLGWINTNDGSLETVEVDGSYAIEPYETTPGNQPKALKIFKGIDPSTGGNTWYYLEYRQLVGFDSSLSLYSTGNFQHGASVHTGTEGVGNSSYLLDMHPETSDWADAALEAGDSYSDSDAGVSFATQWADASGMTVSVNAGSPAACTLVNPSLTVTPGQSDWVVPGTTVIYNVNLTNNNSSGCSASVFDLSRNLPTGWSGSLATSTLSLAPGSSGQTTLSVTSPLSATDGFYNLNVTAQNRENTSYNAQASATYVVSSPAANSAPVATNDTATTNEGTAVTIAVLNNDTDADGDALSVISVVQGSGGSVVINANNSLTYTPAGGFSGNDSFSYTISDGNGGTDSASVSVSVEAVTPTNGLPVAVDDSAQTPRGTPVTVAVLNNDSDPDGDSITVTSFAQGSKGSVSLNPDGTLTYTPGSKFRGADSFTYSISDGMGGNASATVAISELKGGDSGGTTGGSKGNNGKKK